MAIRPPIPVRLPHSLAQTAAAPRSSGRLTNKVLFSLDHRQREAEWMDAPDADPDQLRQSLRFIRRINSLLGYTRATLWHLDRFRRTWNPGQRITMIDFATGSADIPRAVLRWARRREFDVRIDAVDLHAQAVNAARGFVADDNL